MKTIFLIALFLLIGAFFIISENNIHINSRENISELISLYISWLSNLLNNTKTVTGYIVNMDWLPKDV